MATNTQSNIGIRRHFASFGDRNFENDGETLYVCDREPLEFLGTTYHVDDDLPFDVDGTSYSAEALEKLELYWNQGWIKPKV
jgi:hypothetical protein